MYKRQLLLRAGDTGGAGDVFNESLTIRRTLAERDPTDVQAQRDLVISYVKGAECDPKIAVEYYTEALSLVSRLAEENKLATEDHWMPAELERLIKGINISGQ